MASTKLRVAVIGAGAAGLCAARHILASPETFAPPVVFEASDRLGGTWVYTEENEKEDAMGRTIHSSMYRDLRTNLPKEAMAFPDFPFDPSLPSFLHHLEVLAYLDSYAEQFGVCDHIRFQWQVEDIRPIQRDEGSLGGWFVTATLQHPESTQQVTEHFDAIMVCTGHYTVPFIPPIPGLDTFQAMLVSNVPVSALLSWRDQMSKVTFTTTWCLAPAGRLLHSHSYRCPEPFANQSVVLVGAGPSGVDLALQLSPVAAQVVLSHKGQPVCGLPKNVIQLPPLLKVGQKTVVFTDGSKMPADVLILCTGYKYSFPFLDLAQLGLQETDYGVGPLYQYLVPPRHPSLFLIGLCQQICPFPHFHCQVLFALAVLSGRCSLPSVADMESEVERQLQQHLKNGGLARYFLKVRIQQWSYMDNLAQLAGFPPVPPAVQQIYEDTRASRLYNVSTYRSRNYRLLGPSAWELVQDCGGNCIKIGDAK